MGKIHKNEFKPSDLARRLRHWFNLDDEKAWAYKLAAKTDIGASTLQKYMRDEGGVSLTQLIALCEKFDLDPVWLLFGENAQALVPKPRMAKEEERSKSAG